MAEISKIQPFGSSTQYDLRDTSKLPLSGGTLTGNLGIRFGDSDKHIIFDYDGDGTAGGSWRIAALGAGTGDANYFSIESGTNDYTLNEWKQAIRIGQNTLDTAFGGNVYPLINNTKTLGTLNNKWNTVYATTFDGNATTATKATQDNNGDQIDTTYLKLSGGNMTGEGGIQYPTSGGNNSSQPNHYISAGSGYSNSSGKSGIKISVCEQYDVNMGFGADLGGGPYELSIVASSQPGDSNYSFIRFLSHNINTPTTYKKLGEFNGIGDFSATGNITGKKIHSNASSSTSLTHIPTDAEIALETGNGNGSISAWIWREKYDSSNYGIFHNNNTDVIHFVGGNNSRLSIDLGNGKTTGTFVGSLDGNATSATQLSTTGTTSQFWRGDNSWSNILTDDVVLGKNIIHNNNTVSGQGELLLTALGYKTGYPIYTDPTFLSGINSVNVYNNSGGGTVTITRGTYTNFNINSPGTGSDYILKIQTTGTASPGNGGFYQNISSRANAQFIQIFRALVPEGRTLNLASNPMGASYQDEWLTSDIGTGKWEWYARRIICGQTGNFGGGGHVYIDGAAGTTDAPIIWYLAVCNVYDITKFQYDGLRTRYTDEADTAIKISSTPNNTTTFLRGDNTWSNTLTGDIKLTATSGNSPSLLFLRDGSLTDWRIFVTGGKLSFQSAVDGSTWTERAYFKDNSGDLVANSFTGNLIGNASSASRLNISSTDNAIARFDGTNGALQDSTATINDKGTMTIKGKLVVNPSYDTTSNSFNEGIRINQASNGWAEVMLGGAKDSTAGSASTAWIIGRRGAVGSKAGAVGDFTIEEDSNGNGLTIHQSSGGATLYANKAVLTPVFTIKNVTTSNSSWQWLLNAISPNMQAGSNNSLAIGQSNSTKNQAYIGFHYAESGSNNNYLILGLYGVDNAMVINGSGNVGIGTTSPGYKLTVEDGPIKVHSITTNNRLSMNSGLTGDSSYGTADKYGTIIYSNGISMRDPYTGSGNDCGFIRHIETTTNSGYLEIGVGDDGTEPIYVRQYNTSSNIAAEITLLNSSSNSEMRSIFPKADNTYNLGSSSYYWKDLWVKGPIHAYRYANATNLPFIIFDKPGLNVAGIGPDGTSNRIKFGPVNGMAGDAWVNKDTFNSNEWYFQGDITSTKNLSVEGTTTSIGTLTANASGNSISNIKYYTHQPTAGKTYIGWIKIASFDMNTSNQLGNQMFDFFFTRQYNSPAPETYQIRVLISWDKIHLSQLGASVNNQIIKKFRVACDNTNHKIFFEYYVDPSYTTYDNAVFMRIIRYHGAELTLLNEVQTEEDSAFAQKWEITLKDGVIVSDIEGSATKARYVEGDNNAANPSGALLRSGAGRADASPSGDTWIYWDTLGGTTSYWGIRHNQGANTIGFCGSGTERVTIHMGESKVVATTFAGNATSATKAGTSSCYGYFENNNELNFGGTGNGDTIYFGYRSKDSKNIPSKFIFGGSTGSADIQVKTVYLGSGTSSYISSTQYTGNAATATALTSNAGSSTVPIYFSGGKPVQCSTTLGVSITGNAATATTATNATNIYSSASTSKAYVLGTLTASSANHGTVYNASVYTEGTVLYGAAWNDYAEYREVPEDDIEAGRCVREVGDDTLVRSTERLQKGCEIVSDTYGFAIGQTEKANTPIAVTGRVLAYVYEGREVAREHIGDCVCSGPDGTVSIMTEEEERMYPGRIIGTISAVPDYEIWNETVKVNGRVWIRI